MAALLRSMTGFARSRRPWNEGELVVSIKSVNHRALDLSVQAPSLLDPVETRIRALVKEKVIRGHVEVRISLPRNADGAASVALNREFLQEYLRVFRQEAATHGLAAEPDLNQALRIPGMLGEAQDSALPEQAAEEIEAAVCQALEELNVFRAREGREIGEELKAHNARVGETARELEKLREGALEYFQARLKERLEQVARTTGIEPHRLAQEAMLLTDRSDIGEEIARLKIHSAQLAQLLEQGGEVGKKLDFLLQEMNRETNTVLSKTSGAGPAQMRITEQALAAKAAIEKIREQSLNLE